MKKLKNRTLLLRVSLQLTEKAKDAVAIAKNED
jgi:hypothetical protein